MRSLRVVLPLMLVALQAIAIVVIFGLTTFASEDVLLSYGDRLTQKFAQDTTAFTESFLDPADDAAALSQRLAESAVVTATDPDRLIRYFYEILRSKSDFSGIYYGASDGSFIFVNRDHSVDGATYRSKRIVTQPTRRVELTYYNALFEPIVKRDDPADSFDPRQRIWYEDAVKAGTVVWTKPYVFFSARRPGITVATPVTDPSSAKLAGVVGIDIEIDAVSHFLDSLEIGENGSAAVISEDGDIIAHRDASVIVEGTADEEPRFARFDEIGDPTLVAVFESLPSGIESLAPGEARLARVEVDGSWWRGAVQRLRGSRTPWAVVTYLPEDEILAPLKRVRDLGLGVSLLVLVLTAIAGALFARAVTRPIKALAAQADRIADGRFEDVAIPSMYFTELERTKRAVRRATRWLREFMARNEALTSELRQAGEALERRVDERTSELAKVNAELAEANEASRLLAQELDHRVKNLFAMTSALVTLSAREAGSARELKRIACDRIAALSRAHSTSKNPTTAPLRDIVEAIVRPFADLDSVEVTLDGPALVLDRGEAGSLSLILYELATNAAKYGALAKDGGRLAVDWSKSDDGVVHLVWTETMRNGAKAYERSPNTGEDDEPASHEAEHAAASSGFGSQLIDAMTTSLGASLDKHDLAEGGIRILLSFPSKEADRTEQDGEASP
ncbi:Two-component sensor histidine kinase, contains HisKA and HATPase domains [Fulvimarina manganoxydans]|uniref:histidine kinase n=1 Tax=Fulvimarina manganoxydans TaxID=937218 RepID=A0A1W1Y9W2_9HYPH|nr:cache domain-containing protein [Fulvimarina manganoxydans]SMC32952.1 Two-component sensor histidine kinase, contains HisKA and HATPase domains [Fulvimarina manganoxydans]